MPPGPLAAPARRRRVVSTVSGPARGGGTRYRPPATGRGRDHRPPIGDVRHWRSGRSSPRVDPGAAPIPRGVAPSRHPDRPPAGRCGVGARWGQVPVRPGPDRTGSRRAGSP
ncbi:hypothetical protein SHJG_7494 [Streptomyces hygroscopicus subsp. jinggangensis 5008]|nr:hypothetical protein SHJG_7494 [Streptomyces hygroscopicus subsp. jinggangensis 5008]AGF66916.1 hypothetical protein SHJGH_7254 [Streptomyces hygroscopicus subsp. jinggangensis TL01]